MQVRNKILAVIDNRNQIDKLNSVIKIKNSESTELKIFALNYDIGKELASRGLESKTPEDYELSKEAIRDEPLKWFRSWPDNKIKSNKNIKESLSYENKSIWWFLDGWLYLSSFCFDYSIRDILKYALILEHVIGIEKPARIWCAESDTPACRIIGLICQSRGIALTRYKVGNLEIEREVLISAVDFYLVLAVYLAVSMSIQHCSFGELQRCLASSKTSASNSPLSPSW